MTTRNVKCWLLILAITHFSIDCIAADFTLSPEFKTELVEKVSEQLIDRYIYPLRGEVAANELRHRLETGYFDNIQDPRIFANRITGVLDVISDLHLWVNFHSEPIPENYSYLNPSAEEQREQSEFLRERNYGFGTIEILEGDVGYIELQDFFYEEGSSERILTDAMETVKSAASLVIDLRRNGGGSPEMVGLFLSYFLEPGTHINTLEYRTGNRAVESWTRNELDGPRYPESNPVYVLISASTFSAAEAFSYSLQVRRRATLVGERTQGGAHPFDSVRLHEHYMMAVPVARTVDALTDSSWQYVGVRPDYEETAENALSKALQLASE